MKEKESKGLTPKDANDAIRNIAIGVGFGFILFLLVAWLAPDTWESDHHVILSVLLSIALTFPFALWRIKADEKRDRAAGLEWDGGLGIIGSYFWTACSAIVYIVSVHAMFLIEGFVK